MRKLLFLILSLSFFNNVYSQNWGIEGKWHVESKQTKSDLDISKTIILSKDSSSFNSFSMVDSMYCSEYFLFESDSNFTCVGECHAYDPKNNWFNYYGRYGLWMFKNKSTLKLDYFHGYYVTHCIFKIKKRNGKLILKRKEMKTVEIGSEKE